jgi:hypothetical protein
MKRKIQFLLAATLALSVTFLSCKKTDSASTDNSSEVSATADDQAGFAQTTDDVANDGNSFIDNSAAFQGRPNGTGGIDNITLAPPCNASVVLDSANGLRRLTVTYNGANCVGNRTRTGVVVYSMPLAQHWKDAGAVLTISIQNLVVSTVNLPTNRTITINGTGTVTNVSGGRLRDLSTLGTIVHDIASSGMTVTFENGTSRQWQVAKRRTFTYNNGVVISTVGTHSDGSITNISEWGTNRFGNAFATAITQPMTIREDCNWRLTGGQLTHYKLAANVVVTFGLDSSGNPTSCPGLAAYYYKFVWTGPNGTVITIIRPY